MPRLIERLPRPVILVELFVLVNLSFLALDVYFAHSINNFREPSEWIPFYFSLLGPVVLLAAIIWGGWPPVIDRAPRWLGMAVGWTSLAVGLLGMLLHLDSRFFEERTLQSLVYAAPFAAPLAYAGLGFLILLNRWVDSASSDWARWVMLFTFSGSFGNFGLSLADHAQNGFWYWTEWIPVVTAAFTSAFLLVLVIDYRSAISRKWTVMVLLISMLVGVVGAGLHLRADLHGPMPTLFENVVYGAPPFAPLLFPNIALLGLVGVLALSRSVQAEGEAEAAAQAAAPPPHVVPTSVG